MGKITDRQLTTKVDKEIWLIEDAPKGHGRFMARLHPTGECLFYFRYTDNSGKRPFLPLGAFDPRGVTGMTLKEARQRASELSKLYIAGNTNLQEYLEAEETARVAAREAETARLHAEIAAAKAETERLAARTTVTGLFDLWANVDLIRHKDKGDAIRRFFTKDAKPIIGHLHVEDVRVVHINQVLDPIVQRGANRMAKLALTYLRQMFGFAMDRELIQQDPTARLRKSQVGGKDTERDRVLSEVEITELHHKVSEAGLQQSSQAGIWICLATCCRIGELLAARWDHIDFKRKTWYIPAEQSKNGKAHTVYLSDFAIGYFKRVHAINGESLWCYPNNKNTGPVDAKTLTKQVGDRQLQPGREPMTNRTQLCRALELSGGRWTLHDLRRTGATMMVAMRVIPEVAERCLNHTEQNRIKRTYQHHGFAEEMRDAWDLLGRRLELLTT
jgi:integrase